MEEALVEAATVPCQLPCFDSDPDYCPNEDNRQAMIVLVDATVVAVLEEEAMV